MTNSAGTATVLLRAGVVPGTITVKAYAKGLESASISFNSFSSDLTLLYDKQYYTESKNTDEKFVVIESSIDSDLPEDVKKLQEEVNKLRLEVTSKHQDIMDLRSRLGTDKLKKD